MLDLIRNNSQSLAVKIAFGVIILVFVFWGLGSVQSMNSSTTVATVNGEAITVIDFEQAYQQARESVRAQNPQITPEQMKFMQIPQQVLQQLVATALLKEEVKRLGITVAPETLRAAIVSMPAFQNSEGKFDPAMYKSMVEAQFLGAGNFEARVREQLALNLLQQDMTLTAKGFASETAAFFGYTYEERDVDYVFFPASLFTSKVATPAEDSVKAFYESNRPLYTIPAKADVSYVAVYPKDLGSADAISAEAVQKYYDAHQSEFAVRKASNARHILLKVDKDAPQEQVQATTEKLQGLLDQIKNGADFATIAKDNSEDSLSAVEGGSLGWVAEGETVQPFNDAMFSLKPGEISEIIRTDFGVHVIQVEEVREAGVKPLTDVEIYIRDTMAEEAGHAKIREVVDALIEANVLGKDLAVAAKEQGVELKNSDLKTGAELAQELKLTGAQAETLLATGEGVPLDTALSTTDNGYVIARIAKKTEATVRPFEDVKADIVTALTKEEALTMALEAAAEARKGYEATAPLAENIKTVSKAMRGQAIGVLGNQPEMGTALFAANVGEWLPAAYPATIDGEEGAVLVRVARAGTGNQEAWKPMEGILAQALVNQRQEKMFQLYLATLQEKAQVEIVNQSYLDALMAQ